jgi:hypothetical protein
MNQVKLAALLVTALLAPSADAAAEPSPANPLATPPAQSMRPALEEVVVVVKTHFDIGYTHRVRLWTFDATTPTPAMIGTPALEARHPLVAVVASGGGTRLPSEQVGLGVSRQGVVVTAFGANPDGADTLLRVWEQAGVSGNLTVSLPKGAVHTRATPVNLRGEKRGEPVRIEAGRLSFPLGAYAPASFVLK